MQAIRIMRSTICLPSATSALRRAIAPRRLEHAMSSFPFPPRPSHPFQTRTYRFRPDGPGRRPAYNALEKGHLPRDEQIEHRYVHIKDEDGISEPKLTDDVLNGLDRHVYSLVVLALPDLDNERGLRYPLCKVVDKGAERKAQYAKLKEEKKKATQNKELELNWAINPHDLEHRIRRLIALLQKGYKVEVLLLRKKGKKRQATVEEAEEVARRVRAALDEVPGAKEGKPADGKLGESLKLFLEGPPGGVRTLTEKQPD